MNLSLLATLLSLLSLGLMVLLVVQMRSQQAATAALIEDNRIRTSLYQDADESTSASTSLRSTASGVFRLWARSPRALRYRSSWL